MTMSAAPVRSVEDEKLAPTSHDDRVKALGEYLVEDGVLTREQVDRVVGRQKELSASERRRPFGEVVVEMGLATTEQVQRALQRQQRERSTA